jgi:hypothetical protein
MKTKCPKCRLLKRCDFLSCPDCAAEDADLLASENIRLKCTLAKWIEWARIHGHLDHAAGIVADTREILIASTWATSPIHQKIRDAGLDECNPPPNPIRYTVLHDVDGLWRCWAQFKTLAGAERCAAKVTTRLTKIIFENETSPSVDATEMKL